MYSRCRQVRIQARKGNLTFPAAIFLPGKPANDKRAMAILDGHACQSYVFLLALRRAVVYICGDR